MKLTGIDMAGNYVSEDGNQTLDIVYSDSSQGYFSGTFVNKSTIIGETTTELNNANTRYAFVKNNEGAGPGIYIWYRNDDWSDVLFDYWAGTMDKEKNLIMSCAQSYINGDGVTSFKTSEQIVFIRQA